MHQTKRCLLRVAEVLYPNPNYAASKAATDHYDGNALIGNSKITGLAGLLTIKQITVHTQ